MAYFGSALREFSGYWVLPAVELAIETEAETDTALEPAAPEWRTSSGNKLTWVEAWYSVPAYTQTHLC